MLPEIVDAIKLSPWILVPKNHKRDDIVKRPLIWFLTNGITGKIKTIQQYSTV
jgi:hypothetical protein